MKTLLINLFLLLFIVNHSQAQEIELDQPEHLLDGYSLNYQYQSGDAIYIRFEDGELTYKWIAGSSQGSPTKTLPYQSRVIDEDIFLINWHEKVEKNFITLVLNLKNRMVSSSVIVDYGTKNSFIAFQGGIIEHVIKK